MTGNILTALWGNIPQSQEELNFLRTIIYRRQIFIGFFVGIGGLALALRLGIKQYRIGKFQVGLASLSIAQSQIAHRMTVLTICKDRYLDETATPQQKAECKKQIEDAENAIEEIRVLIQAKNKILEDLSKKL